MASTLKVRGIDHIVFHVKNLARSKRFYVDFLGMEVDHERRRQCFLKCGRQGLALFEIDAPVRAGREVNHLALRLRAGKRAEVAAALRDAGIEFSGRSGDPDCIYFRDPDGHRLQLLLPRE
ncbi:MAG TPA: VOC family protein [candidate division Zixibacteria bacterium]|nr:VOC family protein [candidate division Zixibacteria bacterium]